MEALGALDGIKEWAESKFDTVKGLLEPRVEGVGCKLFQIAEGSSNLLDKGIRFTAKLLSIPLPEEPAADVAGEDDGAESALNQPKADSTRLAMNRAFRTSALFMVGLATTDWQQQTKNRFKAFMTTPKDQLSTKESILQTGAQITTYLGSHFMGTSRRNKGAIVVGAYLAHKFVPLRYKLAFMAVGAMATHFFCAPQGVAVDAQGAPANGRRR